MTDIDLRKEIKFQQVMLKAICIKLGITEDELKEHIPSVNNKSEEIKESTEEESKSYPSVEDAPEWKLVFKVNTSEGISTQKVIQKAWTEKQAMFLGRTEQLFNMMNELVKAKQIQPKWNIAEVSAEKIV
jgi:hypothetical protein